MNRPHLRTALVAAWIILSTLNGLAPPRPARAQSDSPAAAPAYVLVPTSAKRVKAVMTVEVKAPKVQADEWSVYTPQIPKLPGQTDVLTTLLPRGKVARELSDEARPMLFERLPAEGGERRQNLSVRVEYEATLLSRRLDRRENVSSEAPSVAPLDARTRRLALASVHHFDHKHASFQRWLDEQKLRREPGEGEVDFARRAFLVVRKGFKHDEGADVAHVASRVCETGKSDFAGLTAVYVAALRSAGIPTRALFGRVVIYDDKPAALSFPHAKAEFFAPGLGWVLADPAGAIRRNRSPDGLDVFGNDPADFLTVHLDTDLVIDTYFGRKTLAWLTEVSWWVTGSGSFDGSKTDVSMTLQVEPLDLADALSPKPAPRGASKPSAKKAR